MSEEKEQVELDDWDETVCGNVANLSAALSNLSEIDEKLMDRTDLRKFNRIRNRIFNALVIYCDCLPEKVPDETT